MTSDHFLFRSLALLLLGASFVASGPTVQAQAEKPAVPPSLTPWIPWVLSNADEARCPELDGVHTCVWPSELNLDANATEGRFTLQVTTDRELFVKLPGSPAHWPEDVQVDRSARPVLEPEGVPAVLVSPGTHVISGRLPWTVIPDTLQIPADVALVKLRVQGQQAASPRREASGLLWLRQGAGAGAEEERLELSVHRRIEDDVPLHVRTRLRVTVSGKGREIVLPDVLVPGTRPVELAAGLPAQLTPEGALRIQAEAGTYEIDLLAVLAKPADTLRAPDAKAPWPSQEIWVFQANDPLRHAELSGAPQIDASRTDLAPDWASLPAYVMSRGQSLRIETRRRGEPEPPPNQVRLNRSLWLDLDGDGYTVSDELAGELRRSFRLDLSAGTLGHARVDGTDQLITRWGDKSGVELRRGDLALHTEWRLEHGLGELPAVGYDEDVQSLQTSLHLPPGFMLLGSHGVDQLPGTWLDGWNLFDFFFVLLVSLAVAKLAGPAHFPVALTTLVLTHHEPAAPTYAWLGLLVTAALMRVVREGRWSKFLAAAFQVSVLGWLLVAVPFATQQVREALYPHLAFPSYLPTPMSQAMSAPTPPTAAPEAAPEESADMAASAGEKRKAGEAWAEKSEYGGALRSGSISSRSTERQQNDVDPNQVVQTGPGVPNWNFRSYALSWSGPVERTQHVSLWILPPLLTRAWSLLSVLFSAALLLSLLRAARRPSAGPGSSVSPGVALFVLACSGLGATAHAQEFPPDAMLEELRNRLTRAPACAPNCISVPSLQISVENSRLTLRAQVHAGAPTAYGAPGPLDSWTPASVRVEGKDAFSAARLDDGFLHVRLDPGLHSVELSGPMPRNQALTLALSSPVHRVEVRAPGYLVEGIDEEGRAEGSISLRRELSAQPGDEGEPGEAAPQALEPWLLVRREFDLGVRFRVQTTVTRVGAADSDVLVRFPLLEGEGVNQAGLASDAGTVVLELLRGQRELSFSSVIAPRSELKLKAAEPSATAGGPVTRPWTETWVVHPSTLFHVDFRGIAPVTRLDSQRVFQPTFRPWPGEELTLSIDKLAAAPGAAVTIDEVEFALQPGQRMEQATLSLQVRSSHGTTERISLPAHATLTGLTVDDAGRSARVRDGVIELHLDPGTHRVKLWLQRPAGIDFSYASPAMAGKRPLHNVITSVALPGDRWLLWASGPSWGPAVLFWGYVIIVVLAALALGRLPLSPLKTHEWVLLGLGLTQVEVALVLFVVGWLFALAYRERHKPAEGLWFNLTQVMLVMLTLVALSCLAQAVHQGLVVQPDMQVQGMESSNRMLRWYTDHTGGAIPGVQVWSLPLWVYKGLMLLWSLWLASSLLRWLRWGFRAFRSGGTFHLRKTPPPPPPAPPQNPQVPLDQIERAQAELDAARVQSQSNEDAGIP